MIWCVGYSQVHKCLDSDTTFVTLPFEFEIKQSGLLKLGMRQYIISVLESADNVNIDVGYWKIWWHSLIPVADNNLVCLINFALATCVLQQRTHTNTENVSHQMDIRTQDQ